MKTKVDAIIIDNNIFCKQCHDFCGYEKRLLPYLFDLIRISEIDLLTHPILMAEAKKYIYAIDCNNERKEYLAVKRKRAIDKLESIKKDLSIVIENVGKSLDSIIKELKTNILEDKQYNKMLEYYEDAITLPFDNKSVNDVFYDYFNSAPPFANEKKKNEFPDAFVLHALKKYAFKNKKNNILVLSDDSDWKETVGNIKNIVIKDKIDDVFKLLFEDENTRVAYCIEQLKEEINNSIEDLIENSALEPNEYYDIISDIEVTKINVVNTEGQTIISSSDQIIEIYIDSEILINGSFIFADNDIGFFDREERKFLYSPEKYIDFEDAIIEQKFILKIDNKDNKNPKLIDICLDGNNTIRFSIDYEKAIYQDFEYED